MNPTERHNMRVKHSRDEGIERGKEIGRQELLAELAREGTDDGPKPLQTLDDIRALSTEEVNSRWGDVMKVLEGKS